MKKIEIEKLRNKPNQLIIGMAEYKEDLELIKNESIDSQKGIFSEIKSTEKVNFDVKNL